MENTNNIDYIKEDDIFTINFKGVEIETRLSDGFINATQMCKAGGKKLNHWYELKSTKKFIKSLEKKYPFSRIIEIRKGNSVRFKQGTWVHPDLGFVIAQWLLPDFALNVSRWIRELYLSGTVQLGHERSSEKLLELQRELKLQEDKRRDVEKKYKMMLKKKNHHKFESGSCFYIISNPDDTTKSFKVGITDNINNRLRSYRTSMPYVKVDFLYFTEENRLIENAMLCKYKHKLKCSNHEWICCVELSDLVSSVYSIVESCCIDGKKCDEIYRYNDE